jgi:F-type H+-transporting ATPase subunit epsilon
MAEGLKIEVVTSVTVPGSEGYFTVMNDHAPFMTTLRSGFITVNGLNGRDEIYFVKGGFADVSPEGLTILAEQSAPFVEFDHAELAAQIKAAEADLATAATPEEKSYAQEVVSALANLAMEAGQINGGHVH